MQGVKLPLFATALEPVWIHTCAWFRNGVHADPSNVQKGLVDALFYAARSARGSADKHTGGSFESPRYDADSPRVEVSIFSAKDREALLEVIRHGSVV